MTRILPARRGLFAFGSGKSRSGASDPVLRLLLAALAVVFVAIVAAGSLASEARAQTTMRLGDVQSGTLLLRTDDAGVYLPAPLVKTDVHMDVGGTIARVTVSQRFDNPSDHWVEGVYAFPLPENAAVDRLRLQIGERFIEGQIKEREEARKIYDQAKAAGQKASLIEEQRPNLFTNEVANIGPHETVLVQIEYQQTVRYDQGAFALRFPLVIGPRYIPGPKLVAQAGNAVVISNPVPDADKITPPILHPSMGKVNPVTLDVELDAGAPLAWIKSPSHDIAVTPGANGRQTVTFAHDGNFADRDFVLEWQPATGDGPATGLFTETIGSDRYLLVTVLPPIKAAPATRRLPRDVTFVIDTSGSMSGPSIHQARQALHLAIDRLAAGDRFNIVRFSSTASRLFAAPEPVERATLDRAHGFVDSLEAEGGTEMLPALQMALAEKTPENRLGQIIFLTDGAVGNEAQLFTFLKERLGATRLFTVGIGSAPNSYFMTKSAEFGHGTYTFIGRVDEVGEKMTALFQKIEEPVVTDVALTVTGADGVEAWPGTLPDLYRGEPIVVALRLADGGKESPQGTVELTGLHAGTRWTVALKIADAHPAKGVGALWARSKINALSDGLYEGVDRETVRRAVIEVALAHHLVIAYTSLVAVDVTPSRPAGADLNTTAVPLNLPDGWNFEKVFGEGAVRRIAPQPAPQSPAAPSPIRKAEAAPDAAGATQLAMARAAGSGGTVNALPQGATPASLKLIAGFLSILLALAILWWYRRQTSPAR
jgi:Ca-activated chloride channel family protein